MTDEPTFEQLMSRAKQGDELAMAELVKQYEPEVRMVASVRLGEYLRPHLDSVDLPTKIYSRIPSNWPLIFSR